MKVLLYNLAVNKAQDRYVDSDKRETSLSKKPYNMGSSFINNFNPISEHQLEEQSEPDQDNQTIPVIQLEATHEHMNETANFLDKTNLNSVSFGHKLSTKHVRPKTSLGMPKKDMQVNVLDESGTALKT